MPLYEIKMIRTYITIIEADSSEEALEKATNLDIGQWDDVDYDYEAREV